VCVPCGCGRKKRQALPHVAEVVRSDERLCNNEQLREIILKGIRKNPVEAKSIIHSEARRKLGGNWVVLCSSVPVSFVSQSPKFCQDGHDDTWCHAFQINH
ncbi:ground-like domain protein, partial [Oesophagostomum dentatum]